MNYATAEAELARDGRIGDAGAIAGNVSSDRRRELIGNETMVERARRYNAHREGGQ